MYKKITQGILMTQSGDRLDRVLQEWTKLSRKKVKSLLDQGRVQVNKRKVIIASWELQKGDEVKMIEEAENVEAGQHYLKVVHEDGDIIVVEKDAGIACEPSPLATKPSLVAILNSYLKRRYTHLKHHYIGLVHRLDQDTSGLMVYSKTKDANKISLQFKTHSIRRKYWALVEGQLEESSGTIEGFLKKSDLLPRGQKVAISTEEAGQHAVTKFKVLERYSKVTLVEATLNTGRTHQIRVHFASLGHPVVGDKVYGKDGKGQKIKFPRQALHACFLGFYHPITGAKMEFKSELPRDMRKLVEYLRETS